MTLYSSGMFTQLLRFLTEPALRALALAPLAALVLALGRAKDAAIRLAVWTTVLYAALAMPFFARLAPAVRLPMPAFLTARSVALSPVPTGSADPRFWGPRLVHGRRKEPRTARPAVRATHPTRSFSWPLVAVCLYLLVAGVLLGRLLVGFYFGRRVKLLSTSIGDRGALAIMLEQTTRWKLHSAPRLAETAAVAVPVTLGAWHPDILLPIAWRAWTEEKLRAVLAHELSHVARRDALTRTLAAIHRSVFWFSPFAWWLERHLAALAEQASDDAALRTGTDRVFYANVLLGFYRDLTSAVGRVRWEGVAMTHGKQAQERVERILDSQRRLSAELRKPSWLLLLLAAPVLYVLAGARPVVAEKPGRQELRAATAAAPVPAAALQEAMLPPPPPAAQAPPAPAEPKPVPAAPPAPKAPAPPRPGEGEWIYGDAGEDLIITYGHTLCGNGSYHDSELEHIGALRRASQSDFIWFRRNGKAYIIRDPLTVERAKDLYAPLRLIEQTQENLETRQDALEAQQEKLSRHMDQVRVNVPDLKAELSKLQAQLDELHQHGATQNQLSDSQNALADLQRKLAELQGEAGGEQGAIGGEKGDLGGRQAELGDQIRQLAEKQARLAKEDSRKMKALLDDALAKGLAKPE